jgi:phospholipase C
METTRRDFLRHSALFAGAGALAAALPRSIRRAAAIDPAPGSTVLDAEHVVVLMQENRSFDHAFGSLRGVRGFNDPRAIKLADGRPVWVQTNDAGESYVPFRLNMHETSSTWMGSLPHSWTNQVDARNGGRYDRWLQTKESGHEAFARMPLTLGYYTRDDLPFYYELADAFTICDQHFCSALTGTNPNRLYLWTGAIRARLSPDAPAMVMNSDVDYESEASWSTLPERLEDAGVAWKVYQNELTLDSGFTSEEDAWLANFSDNPLEWFTQFHVRYAAGFQQHLAQLAERLPREIAELERSSDGVDAKRDKLLEEKRARLEQVKQLRARWSPANFAKLSDRERSLHARAFCTNSGDPNYRELTELRYRDGDGERRITAPKGDVLHQFREDVERGQLPTVSWLVPPERLSDHPSSAWFGAWYVAEVLDILTKKPEVWQRTVFLLTYDENDGYFDHVPPFVAPHPQRMETGRVSASIDAAVDYVTLEQDVLRRPPTEVRDSSIGLGYRVPLVIVSPWSRGGAVCSQVLDHTSPIQFLEKLLSHKLGRPFQETNISTWRRAVCGDLTAAFRPYVGEDVQTLAALDRDDFIEQIHRASFQPLPGDFPQLTAAQLAEIKSNPMRSPLLPEQEPGVRPSAPLPYELAVDGALSSDGRRFSLRLEARKERFGDRSAGAPFIAYVRTGSELQSRNYAVAPGEHVEDAWDLKDFADGRYDIAIYGPNGFFREFQGSAEEPAVSMRVRERLDHVQGAAPRGAVEILLTNFDRHKLFVVIRDRAYNTAPRDRVLVPGASELLQVGVEHSFGWYDFSMEVVGSDGFGVRCAGRVETGAWSYSDPAMGGVVA